MVKDSLSRKEERTSYILLVAPALLLYLFVMAFPAVFSVFLSFSTYRGGPFFGNNISNSKAANVSDRVISVIGSRADVSIAEEKNNAGYIIKGALSKYNNSLILTAEIIDPVSEEKIIEFREYAEEITDAFINAFCANLLYELSYEVDLKGNTSFYIEKFRGSRTFGWGGIAAYKNILTDPYFFVALNNNIKIVLVSILGQIPLGFFLAYILSRGLIKGTDFFQAMIYLPNVIAAVIIGILFNRFLLSSSSIWVEIQRYFNPEYEFIPGRHSMNVILVVILWMYTGIYMLIFLANLQKIDTSIIEASKIDGASEMQTLRYIILPALSGVIVTCIILAISGSLKSFDLIYVMTQGGPARRTNVLSIYMFDKAFRRAPDYPVANAISTIMVVICFILIGLTRFTEKHLSSSE